MLIVTMIIGRKPVAPNHTPRARMVAIHPVCDTVQRLRVCSVALRSMASAVILSIDATPNEYVV